MKKLTILFIAILSITLFSGCMSSPDGDYETYKQTKIIVQDFLENGSYVKIDADIPQGAKTWYTSYTYFWTKSSIVKIEVDEVCISIYLNGVAKPMLVPYETYSITSDNKFNIIIKKI